MKRTKKPPKEKRLLIPAPKTAKELFAIVREFFKMKSPYVSWVERSAAWDVLSALRGPDNSDIRLKRATTAVIRSRLSSVDDPGIPAAVGLDSVESAAVRSELKKNNTPGMYHFYAHARNAFAALGLKWDKNNDPPKKKK